ncbi:RNA polymerase sigma-70 factor [Telluribacter sp.]|jgi:RNA polymerase sigma-70 factor (ECF subfamily)|uniref:RNA polymerase sigma-70 factor n=1 Tax=Telluribacter sp. TaxID=1978767 RepID=UPI002E106748|nr:RNA polymerase sigma-70 factor [Telluribacter sp.]
MVHPLPQPFNTKQPVLKLAIDDRGQRGDAPDGDAQQGDPRQLDAELLLRETFEQDPRKGLELLFRKYHAPLCSHAVRFVYSRQIAEDLVSEVFYQFYRTQAYKNINTSYLSYLFRSVRNEAFTYLRREFGRTSPLDPSTENQPDSQQLTPEAEVQYNHLFLKVNEAIAQLPAQCQRVFLMSRFDNKKYHEIAEELRISPKTVEVHISKALRHLRDALRGEWLLLLLFLFC